MKKVCCVAVVTSVLLALAGYWSCGYFCPTEIARAKCFPCALKAVSGRMTDAEIDYTAQSAIPPGKVVFMLTLRSHSLVASLVII